MNGSTMVAAMSCVWAMPWQKNTRMTANTCEPLEKSAILTMLSGASASAQRSRNDPKPRPPMSAPANANGMAALGISAEAMLKRDDPTMEIPMSGRIQRVELNGAMRRALSATATHMTVRAMSNTRCASRSACSGRAGAAKRSVSHARAHPRARRNAPIPSSSTHRWDFPPLLFSLIMHTPSSALVCTNTRLLRKMQKMRQWGLRSIDCRQCMMGGR